MLLLALTCICVLAIILIGEFLWRRHKVKSELTRKLTHIGVGIFAAFWPWFLSWRQIEIMSLAFFVVVLVSQKVTVFRSIHQVERQTFGELLYAVSIGVTALLTHNKYIFAAAILNMALADGLAAVIGSRFGGRGYKLFGHRKTATGSLTFYVCSLIILAGYFALSDAGGAWPTLIYLPVLATLLENLGIYGTDNILVPLLITLVLKAI